jgi:hypothetical protein
MSHDSPRIHISHRNRFTYLPLPIIEYLAKTLIVACSQSRFVLTIGLKPTRNLDMQLPAEIYDLVSLSKTWNMPNSNHPGRLLSMSRILDMSTMSL